MSNQYFSKVKKRCFTFLCAMSEIQCIKAQLNLDLATFQVLSGRMWLMTIGKCIFRTSRLYVPMTLRNRTCLISNIKY